MATWLSITNGTQERIARDGIYRECLDAYTWAADSNWIVDGGKQTEIDMMEIVNQSVVQSDRAVIGLIILLFKQWIDEGHASIMAVEVGTTPFPDVQRKANAAALSNLPDPFSVNFNQFGGGADGAVLWPADNPASPCNRDIRFRGVDVLPLEIGDCRIEKLWEYSIIGFGFARWPYRSKFIYLFGVNPSGVRSDWTQWDGMEPLPPSKTQSSRAITGVGRIYPKRRLSI